ncbi:MAG TPA: hypothetical protein VMB49_20345 [Acidobacteriaceae bacterium]|nr:hypothetical protein [Acidobacteriaceae bacterium]
MRARLSAAFLLSLLYSASQAQTTSVIVPVATPLSVELVKHVPMKEGQAIDGRLLYPVYVDNRVAIPAGTAVQGRVTELEANRSQRIRGRLRGDFTPFHIPMVQFDQLVLPNGDRERIASNSTTDGARVLHLSPPPSKKKGSVISREIAAEKQRVKDAAAQVTAPGRGDRLLQFLYTQLPYHPQRIDAGTTWVVELSQPLDLKIAFPPATPATDPPSLASRKPEAPEWRLRAYLQQTISSANAKTGDKFQALVSEPVFNAENAVVVPQGSVLVGEITRTKPARSFGRQGKLRFRFRELKLPSGFIQPVEGTLAGADSDKSANLRIDSEGGIQPKSQNRVILPLVLTLLAGRAFDDDGSVAAHNAVASNGFGIVGRVVGIAAGSRNLAAGIGLYAAALSFYDLWLAHGKNVTFAKDTRIEVTTTPARNEINAPQAGEKPADAK